ncbi:MAG: DUF1573 domain-containing protein [Verrucomicrobiota bacterium]
MTRILTFCLVWLFTQVLSLADSALRWDHQQLAFHPEPGEKTVKAEFRFTNIGNQATTIDSVRSSCGCTTVALEKKTFQPGERGCISALFTIGQRKGVQAKGIRVGVHGESECTTLMMVTYVNEAVKIEPQFVFWKTGDEPKPKIVKLIIPASTQLRLEKVVSSDSRISTAVESVKAGAFYNLVITPSSTDRPVMAVLRIETALPSKETKTFQAYAQIKGVTQAH